MIIIFASLRDSREHRQLKILLSQWTLSIDDNKKNFDDGNTMLSSVMLQPHDNESHLTQMISTPTCEYIEIYKESPLKGVDHQ